MKYEKRPTMKRRVKATYAGRSVRTSAIARRRPLRERGKTLKPYRR